MWQVGQILVVLSAWQSGQLAARSRPSASNAGGSGLVNPVRVRRTVSTFSSQRLPVGPILPEHRNQISRSENPL
jgi:hypothetical protein